jgi:hypothetical protein
LTLQFIFAEHEGLTISGWVCGRGAVSVFRMMISMMGREVLSAILLLQRWLIPRPKIAKGVADETFADNAFYAYNKFVFY